MDMSLFSLVGGFGIANIMFVSVKNGQTNRNSKNLGKKTDSYYFSFLFKRLYYL
jgi:hypothetical protein